MEQLGETMAEKRRRDQSSVHGSAPPSYLRIYLFSRAAVVINPTLSEELLDMEVLK